MTRSALNATFGCIEERFIEDRSSGACAVREALLHYIDTQEEHHRARTFQDEYRDFLKKYGIDYDERYVWD